MMEGSSREAFRDAREGLRQALEAGADRGVLADELFAVVTLLDANGPLRRALADPSTTTEARKELALRLFGERISAGTGAVVSAAVQGSWHRDRDLADTLNQLGVEALLRQAADEGVLHRVEDELFRFGRIAAGDESLRSALTDRRADEQGKARLVDELVDGKVAAQTQQLLRRAALSPRGERFDRVVEEQLVVAARMQEQLTALVTAAVPLSDEQHDRLAAALRQQYGKAVQLNVVVDPEVIGGIKVEVEDEVIDGTISSKLDDARARLVG